MGGQLDSWTRDTIEGMVRYIEDDTRIARYCGCDVAAVKRIRTSLPSRRHGIRSAKGFVESTSTFERWQSDARQASIALARAINRPRS